MSRKAGQALYSFDSRVDPKGPDQTPTRDFQVSQSTVDDGKTDQFLDQFISSNFKAQKKQDKYYKKSGTFDYSGDESRAFNPAKMQQMIFDSPYASRDRSKSMMNNIFGDFTKFNPVDWEMPKPGKPIESNADEIAEDYMDEIK